MVVNSYRPSSWISTTSEPFTLFPWWMNINLFSIDRLFGPQKGEEGLDPLQREDWNQTLSVLQKIQHTSYWGTFYLVYLKSLSSFQLQELTKWRSHIFLPYPVEIHHKPHHDLDLELRLCLMSVSEDGYSQPSITLVETTKSN